MLTNQVKSEYRILVGNQIKYISLDPGTLDGDILSFPPDLFNHLPELPPGDWTRARIYRLLHSLTIEPSDAMLKGVTSRWHHNLVDVRFLVIEERLWDSWLKGWKHLHSLGVVHGDLNRYNFVISPSGVTLVDFKNAMKSGDEEAMQKEFMQLAEQLMEAVDLFESRNNR
ncbi:hypothetical protein PILCRDRAFT_6332 [Piloderma croceum F 1598]|uniref:non-specific serine/threonine protein kinase n=1 Tax=Piloderma croceum (strain F 1598) TaxID=765440 RepID=A0A0C3FKY9_PILCF|nr:hypothetical protein PILCRDRAFT_6332 [Piloderma croceum F 1598]